MRRFSRIKAIRCMILYSYVKNTPTTDSPTNLRIYSRNAIAKVLEFYWFPSFSQMRNYPDHK
ncbi:hypothetical protein LEP1GSC061_2981 [Leptospira wolffii serovar Khorat str. Khorat-H2]|nr:hypothetical protein LEP1GSC061_2981 [Leptospira wolffii serovar Khorat str. Khorat-H2]